MYTLSMKKQEIIERYGQAYYDAHLAKCKAALNAKYAAMSPAERTARYLERKESVLEWVAAHPEKSSANSRKHALASYYRMTPEQRLEVARKRRAARKLKLASDPAFAAAQSEKQAARWAKWDATHPGVNSARSQAWDKAHPEVKRANKHSRRALGKMDPQLVKFLRSQPCLDCGASGKPSTVGHLIPVENGGTNHPLNLVAQCRSCNSRQHTKIHKRAMMVHYPFAAALAA